MRGLTWDGITEPNSRDQSRRWEEDSGFYLPCSANHDQDWQAYPVVPFLPITTLVTLAKGSINPVEMHDSVFTRVCQ